MRIISYDHEQLTGERGMDGIVNLADSRKARKEKTELVREAAEAMFSTLEAYRTQLSDEFMVFILAAMLTDQALSQTDNPRFDGAAFLEDVALTARQLYEAHALGQGASSSLGYTKAPKTGSQVVSILEKNTKPD